MVESCPAPAGPGLLSASKAPGSSGHALAWGQGRLPCREPRLPPGLLTCTAVSREAQGLDLGWPVSPGKYLMTAKIANKGLLCSQRSETVTRERFGPAGCFLERLRDGVF